MRIHVASDHAGYELKVALVEHLRAAGHDVVDHGADTYDALDDYPPFCFAAGEAVVAEPGSLGVVIGGSGNGEQIAANKVTGVRAALAWNLDDRAAGPPAQRRQRRRDRRPPALRRRGAWSWWTRSWPSRSATTRATSAGSTCSRPTRPRASRRGHQT